MVKKKWIIIIALDILIFIMSFLHQESMMMVWILVVWGNGLIYTLEALDKRAAVFSFLVSFFLILVGREALEVFGLHEIEANFSDELNFHAEQLILISLLTFFLGYKIADIFSFKTTININYNSAYELTIRRASSILFFVTFSFNIVTVADVILYVFRNGYMVYYTSYVSGVPYIIKKIGDMCIGCFWIFLATMPEKKQVNKMSKYYFFYLLLTLGTGKRFPFVAGLLTLFVYYIARNKVNNGGEVWLRRKTLVLLFALAPIMLMSLYIIGNVRVDNAIDTIRIDKIILNFFYNQGVSINVIKRAQVYKDSLPQGKYYLFGSTLEAIFNNIIFRTLGFPQFSGNTVEHAVRGYSFQHALSYIAMGNYYLAGHGLGSCYIAEAFHDLRYFGVVIVNLIYGILFNKAFDFRRHGIWGTTIILIMLYSLLLAPRGSADGFITDIVDLTTWGTILIVWLFSKMLYSKSGYTMKSFIGSSV